jgi:outer membrane receptor protein involved in Fe transport
MHLALHRLAGALALAGLMSPCAAQANPEVAALRAEIEAMKRQYEARLAELETRLKKAEAAPQAAPAPAPDRGGAVASAGAFNPEVSLILQGRYAHRDDREERGLTGFLLAGGHTHGTERGFSVDHSELVLAASIDPYWRGQATLAFVDQEVAVEEAWFQSLGLGAGLTLKGGRFYSALGYVNEQHPHAWDFADAPLMYQALFGERLSHDGLQLKWLAPTETFLEFGLEAARGQNFPGGGDRGNNLGALTAFAKVGGDVGQSHSWRLGLARLTARPKEREAHWYDTNDDEVLTHFSGRSRAWVADFVWKWAPLGNPRVTNFKFQAEWFRRTESGEMECEDGLCGAGAEDRFASRQSGWYAQAVYQFMPRWRLGARYDRLDAGRMDFGALPLETKDYRPVRASLMADWSPSEFSRLRLQYARDKSMQGKPEDQWTLQYVMSLGAHGAHKF